MRIELIHPFLVYFPLVFLTIGTVLRLFSIFYPNHLLHTSWIVLSIGLICAWITILVGEYTTKIIALRNPSFYSQQLFAQRAVYFFTGGLILDWAKTFLDKIRQYKIFSVLCVILYLAALYLLPYIGMFSSSLIIEQEEIVEKK